MADSIAVFEPGESSVAMSSLGVRPHNLDSFEFVVHDNAGSGDFWEVHVNADSTGKKLVIITYKQDHPRSSGPTVAVKLASTAWDVETVVDILASEEVGLFGGSVIAHLDTIPVVRTFKNPEDIAGFKSPDTRPFDPRRDIHGGR